LPTVVVRSIRREYRIRSASAEIVATLGFIEASPEMPGPSPEVIEVDIDPVADGFRVSFPDHASTHGTSTEAVALIYKTMLSKTEEEVPGAPLVHAATLRWKDRRLALLGAKGVGKSTLALHLACNGFDIEGDEHLLARERDVVARPRRLHVKPSSLALVPSLAEAILASPRHQDPLAVLYGVSPSITGRPWRIEAGRLDHLFILDPHHGGSSAVAPATCEQALGRLLTDCILPSSRRAIAAARLRRLAGEARSWRLSLGQLDEAATLVRQVIGQEVEDFP
jgi:hypothetical protein